MNLDWAMFFFIPLNFKESNLKKSLDWSEDKSWEMAEKKQNGFEDQSSRSGFL